MKIEIEFKDQKELEETIKELDEILSHQKNYSTKCVWLLDKLSETIE